ncbi:MAG: hypothetical protein KAG61_05020 [Bacteriovoracaceae bacterium]|nr:hypothetical protein [Bacteriovoracaceae bacterium]
MSDVNKENFLKLDIIESGNKFSTLVLNGAEIKIWMPEDDSFIANLKENGFKKDGDGFSVDLKSQLDYSKWKGNKVLFSFNMIGMLFFGEAQVGEWSLDNSFSLSISEGIFRFEKRNADRLLAYPSYKIYCYFYMAQKGSDGKVAYLNRPDQKVEETLSAYINKKSLLDDQGRPLSGLRVLDISEAGISFVASAKEVTFFKEEQVNLLIELEGEHFSGKGNTIYAVDYIDPRISNVRLFKVGMTMNDLDQAFILKMRTLLGNTVELLRPESHFEDFIK